MSGLETGSGAIAGDDRLANEDRRDGLDGATSGADERSDGHSSESSDESPDAGASSDTGEPGDAPAGESGGSLADAPIADEAAVPTVGERVCFRRTDAADEVETAIAYEVPEAVTKLAFWIERPAVSVVAVEGFERSGVDGYTWQGSVDGPAFEWDGVTERPRVVVRHPLATGADGANPSTAAERSPTYGAGTDEWALCLRPRTHTRWRYRGTEPEIDRTAAVSGTGVAGDQFAFLGAYDCATRRVGEEQLRLVVPDAAEPAESPERILATLGAASGRLDVGRRTPVVTVFVAPTDGVEWAHRGLSLGPDARVNDAAPIAAPTNIWVHEYVHTRQDRSVTTPTTEWLLEATAEYYAAVLAFERDLVDFPTFRRVLERGVDGPAADAILADPATWADDAQYRKGALVVAALDRRIRAATDGAATFQAVVRAWNQTAPRAFDAAAFADAVEAVGGAAARVAAVSYTQTATTPRCWDGAAHAATFGEGTPAATDQAAGETAGALAGASSSGTDRRAVPGLTSDERAAD